MATENITILRVGTSEAVKNVAELRDNIKALKAELDRTDASFEENARVTEELRKNQAALRDAMYGTASSAEDLLAASASLYDENGKLNGSYNDLVHSMADLKAAWRATTDEAERAALGEQINKINASLKEMDASTGNFSRNVGDYTNAFKKALGDMPSYLGAGNKALKDMNATIGAVQKQPLLFIVAGIATIIEKITSALKDNENAQQSVKKVMDALQPVFNVFQGILDKIAGFLGKMTDKLLEVAGTSTGAFKNVVAGAVGVGNAILQFLLTPIKTTIEAVKGLGATFKEVFSGNFKKAAEEAKNALKSIGSAVVDGVSFKKNFEAGKKVGEEFANGIGAAKKKVVSTAKAVQDEANKAVEESLKERLAMEANLLKQEADMLKRGSAERLAAEKAALKAQLDAETEAAKESISNADQLKRQLLILQKRYDQQVVELEQEHREQVRADEIQLYKNRVALAENGSAEYLAAMVELRQKEADTLERLAEETDAEYEARRIEARKNLADALKAVSDAEVEDGKLRLENEMNALQENSLARVDALVALKQYELDTIHRLEGESNDAFRARELAAEDALTEAKRAQMQARVSLFQSYAGALSGVMGSIADILEQEGEHSEKAAKDAKALRIASATIDTISGAVGAYMQAAATIPPPAGIIIGALSAAAVTASGVAQIMKIKNTDVSRKSSGSTAISSAGTTASIPSLDLGTPMQSTTIVRGASEEQRLNDMAKNQKVVLVTSELEAEQMQAKRVEVESTF